MYKIPYSKQHILYMVMQHLLFKQWLLSEMANYGHDARRSNRPMGGTETIHGDDLFDTIDTNVIMDELAKLPLGPNNSNQKWNNIVEWGTEVGAIQIECSQLGALRLVTRRKISDLQGEVVWICKNVRPISDVNDENKEIGVAHESYESAAKLNTKMIDAPARDFPEFERLAWRMWAGLKREHPSYAMFPIGLRKQNDDWYKMVFEFRGGGQGNIGDQGFLRQFDVDLLWDKKKGIIRCWGSNIDSAQNKSDWGLNPPEWNEFFSPAQDHTEIIECIVKTFMQY